MAIPDFQTVMLPLLSSLEDGGEHSLAEIRETLADHFSLSQDEREELLPSGNQAIFENRVGWARTYLKNAGLLHYVKRGVFQITERGTLAAITGEDEYCERESHGHPLNRNICQGGCRELLLTC